MTIFNFNELLPSAGQNCLKTVFKCMGEWVGKLPISSDTNFSLLIFGNGQIARLLVR